MMSHRALVSACLLIEKLAHPARSQRRWASARLSMMRTSPGCISLGPTEASSVNLRPGFEWEHYAFEAAHVQIAKLPQS